MRLAVITTVSALVIIPVFDAVIGEFIFQNCYCSENREVQALSTTTEDGVLYEYGGEFWLRTGCESICQAALLDGMQYFEVSGHVLDGEYLSTAGVRYEINSASRENCIVSSEFLVSGRYRTLNDDLTQRGECISFAEVDVFRSNVSIRRVIISNPSKWHWLVSVRETRTVTITRDRGNELGYFSTFERKPYFIQHALSEGRLRDVEVLTGCEINRLAGVSDEPLFIMLSRVFQLNQ